METTIEILEKHKKDLEEAILSYMGQLKAQRRVMESTKKDIENREQQLHEIVKSISILKEAENAKTNPQ